MSDAMKYNFGGIEGAATSGVSREESSNPQGLDLTPDEESELDEETTLVRLNETQEEMTKLGDASDLDPGELGDGGIEHVDDWETPVV
jgi:hypothetical protein